MGRKEIVMISFRSVFAAAFGLVMALASANAQTRPVRMIPLTPATSTAPAAACTPAAAEMKAAIAACGKGEVKAIPKPHKKRVVNRQPTRTQVVVRTVVRTVYRDRPTPNPNQTPGCVQREWTTRALDGQWYSARACVYERYVKGVTLDACRHLTGSHRYPSVNQLVLKGGRWIKYTDSNRTDL